MTRLLKCQKCGDFTDRLINYDDHDICLDCFVEKREEEAIDVFNDQSFDWYEIDE